MKRIISFIFASALVFLSFSIAFAVPASPGLKEVKMPDGTKMKVRLIGDEHVNWLETADGYTILKSLDGYYEYARRDDSGRLVPSGIKAGEKPLPAKKHIRQSRELIASRVMSRKAKAKKEVITLPQITGTEKVIVLLIEFADVTHTSPAHDPSYFNSLYFDNTFGNMNHYMQDISYGQLDIAGGISQWGVSVQNMAYYGQGQDPGLSRIDELVLEAVVAADATVDFSQYDQDSDNYVDHLIIVHAGGDYAITGDDEDIWSHSWAITPYYTSDGVWVSAYAMAAEDDPMGVHAHEFMHDLGAPDLYDYDSEYFGDPVNYGSPVAWWCIMDTGAYGGDPFGSVPTGLCGYLRYDLDANPLNGYLGWLTPNIPTQNNDYTIARLNDLTGDRLYRLDIPGDNEFFMVENRQFTGYDASLTDSGIVVYHVDENMPNGPPFGTINDGPPWNSFYRIVVENPGTEDPAAPFEERLDAAYSQDDGQVIFDNYSSPNSRSNQSINSNIAITNIGASQPSMTFSLSLTGSNTPPVVGVSASPASGEVPLTVTFTGIAADIDGSIASYHYDFDDGEESTERNPVHSFSAIGDYTVTFTATDDDGASSFARVDISVITPSGGGGGGGGCGTISGVDLKPPSNWQIVLDLMFFMIPVFVIFGRRAYKVIRY